jgi:hypothetical protein
MVEAAEQNKVDVTWRQVKFNLAEEKLTWSEDNPLRF